MGMKEVFSTLNAINVNEHTEKKKSGSTELTYLSWTYGIAETMKKYPDMKYTIWKDEQNRPYLYDENLGYMVFTSVTIEDVTKEMWLPVMDSHNAAMKNHSYEVKTKYSSYTVPSATMFDINKTIMRCLVKNLAMFGLGLYIYAGEDLPEGEEAPKEEPKQRKSYYNKTAEKTAIDVLTKCTADGIDPIWLASIYHHESIQDMNAKEVANCLEHWDKVLESYGGVA